LAPGFHNGARKCDYWLSQEVPKILNSHAYKDNGALFITWDEGTDFTDGPMGMIVLSPLARGGGYSKRNSLHPQFDFADQCRRFLPPAFYRDAQTRKIRGTL